MIVVKFNLLIYFSIVCFSDYSLLIDSFKFFSLDVVYSLSDFNFCSFY